jgi:sulfur-carrier protein
MARVSFTANLRRHREARAAEADGGTVREVLDRVFAEDPLLRSYIVDDQGRLRRHVNVFVSGRMIADRRAMSDPVGPADEIYVLQALSGG